MSIIIRKFKSALGLLRQQDAWTRIVEHTGENFRKLRLRMCGNGRLCYRHRNGFPYVVVPGIPETEEIYVHQQRYEATECAVIRNWLLPGDFALDCGANVGLMCALMADCVGQNGAVLAVEASPTTAAKLETVLQELSLNQVRVVKNAVSDSPGDVIFNDDSEHSEANAILSGDVAAAAESGASVVATTLESLVGSAAPRMPALVKMDIEGVEPLALRGWPSLALMPSPPLLIFEVYPRGLARQGLSPADIFRAMPLKRYDLWHLNNSWPNEWLECPRAVPFVLQDPFSHPWPMHSNVIAVPREGEFAGRAEMLKDTLPPQLSNAGN
jgi:FkbM family methyltransferase